MKTAQNFEKPAMSSDRALLNSPDGENESDTPGRPEEDATVSQRTGEVERPLGSLLMRNHIWLFKKVGLVPSMSRGKVGHNGPIISGKTPCKEFLKGRLKKPWSTSNKRAQELLICKWPFSCLVHETAQTQGAYDHHFQVHAIAALDEDVEYYLVNLFEDANMCATHA